MFVNLDETPRTAIDKSIFINRDTTPVVTDQRLPVYQSSKEQTPTKIHLERVLHKVRRLEETSKITITSLSISEGVAKASVEIENTILKLSVFDVCVVQELARELVSDLVSRLQPQIMSIQMVLTDIVAKYETE